MNVLVLSNYFDRDGVTSKVLTEGKYLAPLGIRLVVIVPRNPFARADAAAKLQALGITYYHALTHSRVLYFLFPFAFWRIYRIIRREKIDLLYVNHGKTVVLGVILSRLRKIPLVYTIHGVSRRELPLAFNTFLFHHVSRVMAVSEESAAYFKSRVRYPAQRVVVSRNAIDFSHFKELAKNQDSHLNLLLVSRLDPDKHKAVEAAMDAVARVFPEQPQIRLRILGGGRRYGKIRRKARLFNAGMGRETIVVDGWVDDVAEHFAAADVILGAGRCVLEALAAGKPALVVGNEGIGSLVMGTNFYSLQKTNFSGRGTAVATSGENLARELRRLSGKTASSVKIRELARSDHDAARLALAIKEIFLQAAPCSSRKRFAASLDLAAEMGEPCPPKSDISFFRQDT
jgi:glycosyltransferase involved in cell wall biosynthesis